jgi:antitoxin component YwqK of YwqJK toxin-antitoxin module
MKQRVKIILILVIFPLESFCQKIFYDSLWHETEESQALYYRIIDTISNNTFDIKDYFLDGTIQMKGQYSSIKKDKRVGQFIWYTSDGTKSIERNYKEGKLDGAYKIWYDNGSIKLIGKYKAGKEDSIWIWWYENSNLWAEESYLKGEKYGLSTIYHPNGNKKESFSYNKGKFNGYKWYFIGRD